MPTSLWLPQSFTIHNIAICCPWPFGNSIHVIIDNNDNAALLVCSGYLMASTALS